MSDKRKKILLVDDDPGLLRLLTMRLESLGYRVESSTNGREGLAKVDLLRPDLLVTDLRMDQMDGYELFKRVRQIAPFLPVIIMTAHGTIPEAVRATREGVFSYITKPIDKDAFLAEVEKALKVSAGMGAKPAIRTEGSWDKKIHSRSPLMHEVVKKARLVTESDVKVLITGESGTGKELLARTIHENSLRNKRPFVVVSCSVISEPVLLREMIDQVQGGTLFLKEVGSIPASLQVPLLDVLKSASKSELDPVRGFRVISSSTRDLKSEMATGGFREDLYYSLGVVSIDLPALRERREDVSLLSRKFLNVLSQRQKVVVKELSPDALKLLTEFKWPGNIRQLYHVIEQVVALSTNPVVPASLVEEALGDDCLELPSFTEARSRFERDYLIRLLKMSEGNVSQAARSAKRNRTDFYKLLARHNIEPGMFKKRVESPDL
tara:strand:+ start:1177 stop:2487 length:1311 start_codon:yes stop_codon:yes gene_type:complete